MPRDEVAYQRFVENNTAYLGRLVSEIPLLKKDGDYTLTDRARKRMQDILKEMRPETYAERMERAAVFALITVRTEARGDVIIHELTIEENKLGLIFLEYLKLSGAGDELLGVA